MPAPLPSTARRGVFQAEVLANRPVCREHFLLRLAVPHLPPTRPGQFVQLQCRHLGQQAGYRLLDWPAGRLPRPTLPELAGREPLLRRPFSLARRRDTPAGAEIDILYRVVGMGTGWLSRTGIGAATTVLGPLGNAFAIRPGPAAAALVGGGVGIPPMLYLAETLVAAGKDTFAFSGAATADLLPLTLIAAAPPRRDGRPGLCVREFAVLGVPVAVTTDDGSAGFRGFVSEAFGSWLAASSVGPGDLVVYACGPEPMMRAVGNLCVARGIECQLALERHMACGMGTCQSCVCKVRAETDRGWAFRLVCTDGPVFDARDVVW